MTDHPCKGMTRAQRDAFERIATNQTPNCMWLTIDALMAAGVIERGQDEVRHDALGRYVIPSFYVPLNVHRQWCAWCAQHHNEDDPL